MLTEERHKKILQLVNKNDIVNINELLQCLDASESTLRRDLQTLEDQGSLTRIHGGAKKKQDLNFEASMEEKTYHHHQEKVNIAQVAAALIQKNDIIYLDAGSTTIEMIAFLPTNANLKIVTNSVRHASLLIERKIETIILGGNIKLSTQATYGASSSSQLENFHFNKAFLGMNGAHLKAGFTTPDPEEAALKKIALTHCEKAFVLLDASKFQRITFTKVADLDAAEIITNHCPKDVAAEFHKKTRITEVVK